MMKTMFLRSGVVLALLPAVALFVGCSGKHDHKDEKAHKDHSHSKTPENDDDEHTSADGYWCNAHGIPEKDCSMCSPKVEKACKAKGDWCEKHNRARSQCFICEPKLKEKYDAEYRTKYGKEPPLTDDEKKAKKKANNEK